MQNFNNRYPGHHQGHGNHQGQGQHQGHGHQQGHGMQPRPQYPGHHQPPGQTGMHGQVGQRPQNPGWPQSPQGTPGPQGVRPPGSGQQTMPGQPGHNPFTTAPGMAQPSPLGGPQVPPGLTSNAGLDKLDATKISDEGSPQLDIILKEMGESNDVEKRVQDKESEATKHLASLLAANRPEILKMNKLEPKTGKSFRNERDRHKLAGRNLSSSEIKRIKEGFEIPRYKVNVDYGLTNEIVAERRNTGLANDNNIIISKSDVKVAIEASISLFNILALLIAVGFLVLDVWAIYLFILVITASISINVYRELKDKVTMEAIVLLSSIQILVIREGEKRKVPVRDVVLDDIVFFNKGDRIFIDAIVVEGEVELYDNVYQTKSEVIKKKEGDIIEGGSLVLSGNVKVQVTNVDGMKLMDDFINRTSGNSRKIIQEIIKVTDFFLKVIAGITLLLAVVLLLS